MHANHTCQYVAPQIRRSCGLLLLLLSDVHAPAPHMPICCSTQKLGHVNLVWTAEGTYRHCSALLCCNIAPLCFKARVRFDAATHRHMFVTSIQEHHNTERMCLPSCIIVSLSSSSVLQCTSIRLTVLSLLELSVGLHRCQLAKQLGVEVHINHPGLVLWSLPFQAALHWSAN